MDISKFKSSEQLKGDIKNENEERAQKIIKKAIDDMSKKNGNIFINNMLFGNQSVREKVISTLNELGYEVEEEKGINDFGLVGYDGYYIKVPD